MVSSIAGIPDFTYAGNMKITVSLDDKPVRKLREIAMEQHTTLSRVIRDFLTPFVSEGSDFERRRREPEACC